MYNTIDCLDPVHWKPTPAQPGLAPWRAWFARHWPSPGRSAPTSDTLHDDLAELDAHTLADIGAPEPLQGRAMARREARRQEREGLALGLASGAWHHW